MWRFSWDPQTDGSCKAYGAAGLMRMPTRLNISWQGDDVLKVESDAGQQTRLLQFAPKGTPGPRSLQGFSVAEWEPLGVCGRGARRRPSAAQSAEGRHDEPARGMASAERRAL